MAKGTTPDVTPNANPVSNPGLPRIEIKNADAVQSSLAGAFNWVEDNAKVVVAVLVIAILASIGYAGLQWVGRRQERAAQEAYYMAESKFTKLKEGFDKAKFKAFLPPTKTDDPSAPKETPASGDLAKDYGTVLGDLEKIAKDHAGTAAGAQAGLLVADTYVSYKQPDKAIEYVQVAATKLKPNQTLQQLSVMMWGNALAVKGDCQQAVTHWQTVLKNDAAQFLHPDASLRSGLCLEKMGNMDAALEMYRKAASASESAAGTAARGFLRALEVKGAQPKGNG
ncbi:MAG: tetratricopeptide repeat protein [Bdellovibrionota bacterium]